MTGYDGQHYEYTKRKAKNNKMNVSLDGNRFCLSSDKKVYGYFDTLEGLFQFICGYEVGKNDNIL